MASPGTAAGREQPADRGQGVITTGEVKAVRPGLGWPETTPGDVASLLARRGSVGRPGSAMTVAAPVPPFVVREEGGLGWPPGDVAPRRPSRAQAGVLAGSGQEEHVSRETATPAEQGGGRAGPEARSVVAGGPGREERPPVSGPSRGPMHESRPYEPVAELRQRRGSAPATGRAEATRSGAEAEMPRLVARHGAPLGWFAANSGGPAGRPEPEPGAWPPWARAATHEENARWPGSEIGQRATGKTLPDPGAAIPAEGQVWISGVQGSIPAGRMTQGSDGPIIAGTYSGALSAPGESEDEVAIPAPDTSADTPIARAAQAAMKARAGGQAWPRPGACRILTIANQKGGVGKTTTAVNLAASLAMNGSRVLVVDLDPQGNASTALDVEHRSGTSSIYNVLVDGRPLADVIRPVQGFSQLLCAPATIDLAGSEIELVPMVAREARLSRAVAQYDSSDLDYIFIDCPPSLGLLTVNALVAAPEVLIPIQCEYYALEGLEQLLRTVDLVKSHLNQRLRITTILLTMFDSRTRLASQVADEVRSHFGDLVLSSVIPRSVRVSEAPSYGQSVMTYDPGSSGALAYLEAAREMAFRNSKAATA
jgi:chromosome partitioning protein